MAGSKDQCGRVLSPSARKKPVHKLSVCFQQTLLLLLVHSLFKLLYAQCSTGIKWRRLEASKTKVIARNTSSKGQGISWCALFSPSKSDGSTQKRIGEPFKLLKRRGWMGVCSGSNRKRNGCSLLFS